MKVKICGITHPEDAEYAAHIGADYIGMIFADRSKRKVSLSVAKDIVEASKNLGGEPVGIFMNQTADEIASICEQTGLKTLQLHGTISQQALFILSRKYCILYAISGDKGGSVCPTHHLPSSVILLYDNSTAGSGVPFHWMTFSPPKNRCWMLAGGLTPENVAEAIALLNPYGVDVATGVEFPNSARKDPLLLTAFIQAAKSVQEKP